jgi:L-lactate dehydrogenase
MALFVCVAVVWSGLSVAGVRLVDLNPDIGTENDPERWLDIHKKVIDRFVH